MLLSTDIWVGALIRRAELGGAFAMVARKGDARAGAVLVKIVDRRAGTARLYSEATRGDGERFWMQPVRSEFEPDLDAYAERAARIDPDVWVVEIEDREGRHFLTEAVEAQGLFPVELLWRTPLQGPVNPDPKPDLKLILGMLCELSNPSREFSPQYPPCFS